MLSPKALKERRNITSKKVQVMQEEVVERNNTGKGYFVVM